VGNLYVVLLHEGMLNKKSEIVTTSLTLIDVHDIARSSRTYGVKTLFIAHPSEALRNLGRTLKKHWEDGYGATYNPDRKEALSIVEIVGSLDDAINKITQTESERPIILATDGRAGEGRIAFSQVRDLIKSDKKPYLLVLGTGWGMCPELINRCDLFIEPIIGPSDYNHLSVRSAAAVLLDRLVC